MKLLQGTKNRGVIYFFYDGDGIVDRYVTCMLREMKKCVKDLYVVINGTLTDDSRETLLGLTDCVWERENKGLDVGAYQYALKRIGWEKLETYDEVILMNHTIMGPVFPLQEMFDTMAERDLDFWGSNIFYQVDYDPYGLIECGYIRTHLQSHFIAARRSLVSSADYHDYWENMPVMNNYAESVAYHETYFTHHFSELGYQWAGYAHFDGLDEYSEYPLLKVPALLLERTRCPFFKRRSFMHNYDDFLNSTGGESTSELLRFLEEKTGYDTDLIWENILRTANQADIKACLNLNFTVASDHSSDMKAVIDEKKVALIYHFYYEDCLEELLHYASSMPENADIYLTVGNPEKEKLLEKAFASFPNRVRILPVENRGRDVSALLIGARDVVSRYEYVCFAHDKKVVQLKPQSQGAGWAYKCFENVMGSRHVVNNIIRLFEENPRMGLLSPAPPNHAGYYSLLGEEWTVNFKHVKELAERLGVHVPMDPDKEPIAPIGTIFWFRTKAFEQLFSAGWTYEDFPAEPARNDGTLSHAIERYYPFAVQAAGYYPAWIFSDRGASLELNNLDYMLREFNSILYRGGIGGPDYLNTRANLENVLKENKKEIFLTPTLYLDHGKGYNETETLHVANRGNSAWLKAVFEWPEGQPDPLRARFDPCEEGGAELSGVKIFALLPSGKRKEIPLDACVCNGAVSGDRIRFENPDPWIDISWNCRGRISGLEIRARVSLLEAE